MSAAAAILARQAEERRKSSTVSVDIRNGQKVHTIHHISSDKDDLLWICHSNDADSFGFYVNKEWELLTDRVDRLFVGCEVSSVTYNAYLGTAEVVYVGDRVENGPTHLSTTTKFSTGKTFMSVMMGLMTAMILALVISTLWTFVF